MPSPSSSSSPSVSPTPSGENPRGADGAVEELPADNGSASPATDGKASPDQRVGSALPTSCGNTPPDQHGGNASPDQQWESRVREIARMCGAHPEDIDWFVHEARHELEEIGLEAIPENAGVVMECMDDLVECPVGRWDASYDSEDLREALLNVLRYHSMSQTLAMCEGFSILIDDDPDVDVAEALLDAARTYVEILGGYDGKRLLLLSADYDPEVHAFVAVDEAEFDRFCATLPTLTDGSWQITACSKCKKGKWDDSDEPEQPQNDRGQTDKNGHVAFERNRLAAKRSRETTKRAKTEPARSKQPEAERKQQGINLKQSANRGAKQESGANCGTGRETDQGQASQTGTPANSSPSSPLAVGIKRMLIIFTVIIIVDIIITGVHFLLGIW